MSQHSRPEGGLGRKYLCLHPHTQPLSAASLLLLSSSSYERTFWKLVIAINMVLAVANVW